MNDLPVASRPSLINPLKSAPPYLLTLTCFALATVILLLLNMLSNFHHCEMCPKRPLYCCKLLTPHHNVSSMRAVLSVVLRETRTGLWNPSITALRSALLLALQARPEVGVKESGIRLSPQPWHPSPKATGEFPSFSVTSVLPFHVKVVKSTLTCEGQVAWETDRKCCTHVVSVMRYTACTRSQKCFAC